MKQSVNTVNITGVVESIDMRHIQRKDGKPGEYLAGTVVVRTNDKSGNECTIPVEFFTSQYKKDGTTNKIYTNIATLEGWNTIENSGISLANKVEIRGAEITENLFVPQDKDEVVSTYRVNSSFFTKVGNSVENKNDFRVTGVVTAINNEQKPNADGDLEDTGRIIVYLAVVGYNDKVEVIKLFAENPQGVEFIRNNWTIGSTVTCGGYFKFTTETIKKTIEMGFGDPEEKVYTKNTKEIIILRGSQPLEEDEGALDPDEVKAGLQTRKDLMAQTLAKAKDKKVSHPADDTSDFGF